MFDLQHYVSPSGPVPRVAPVTNTIDEPATQGPKVGPHTNDLLADTGQKSAGAYEFRIFAGATVETTMNFEHRNATNSGNISVVTIFVPAFVSAEYVISYNLAANERFRVVMADNLIGTISVAIQGRQLAI